MVGFPNPAQVGSSTPSKRRSERKWQSDKHGPQPLRALAAAAAAANPAVAPAPLDNAIQVRDGSNWFARNILEGRNPSSSQTAGPSGSRRGLDLAEDEVSPPDLGDLDRVYTPGPGHILKYANTLTMTFEERMETAEVQDLLQIIENRTVIDSYCKDLQAVAAAGVNGVDVDTIMDSVNATLVAFGEQFSDLPWGDICDILLPSTLKPDLPGPGQLARLTDEANFQDDLLRNAVAYCGGYSDSADARPSPRSLQSLTHGERTRWLDQFQAVITRMEQDARRAGADPSASKLAIQAASMTKEEVDARLAAKMAAIELARKVPSAGTIQGLGAHLESNAGPSMPVSETTEKQVGAVPMYGDDIVDSLASLMNASAPKAESSSSVRADLRTGNLITPAKLSASAGPSTHPVSAYVPLMYDPGKHGRPAGPGSDDDEPSSPVSSAKSKKKNKKKKKKSGAHSSPRSPVTMANRPSTPHPRKYEIGHEGPLSVSSPKAVIEVVELEPLAPASPSDSPLPRPPSDMQHPLPPRPSFASFHPTAPSTTYSDSLGFAQAIMDSIINVSDSPEVVHAKLKAAERTSSIREPVTFSVPPPPLDSPPPLDAAEEREVAKQELPSGTENKLEEQHDIEDIRLRVLQSMTSGLNIEDRNAVTRGVLANHLVVEIEPKPDTHVPSTPVKPDQTTAEDNDKPTPVSRSPAVMVSRVDLRARFIRYHAQAPWIDMPELSSDFEEYIDSPFDKAFGDALSNNVSKVQVEPPLSAPLEKQTTKDIRASNNEPASREEPTIYQKPETNEKPGSNRKSELEVGRYSNDDGRMDMMERPGITPSRERRRARAYSSTNSEAENNPFTDVGDATFETTQIFTPFTPDDEALFASPAWTDVPRDPMTPLSPSRGPAASGSNPALLASATTNEDGSVHQPQSAPESPTTRLTATSAPVAQFREVLEPELTGNVPETEAADLAARTEEHVGPAVYVPYEELFIDRSGNIMDRKAAKSRVVESPSTSADPFLVVDRSSRGNNDDEAISPDSFVNVSPAAGAFTEAKPMASTSYVLVPPPNAGIKSNASGSQRPVFVPRPLAPVLEEEEWEDGEEDPFRPTAPTPGGKMRIPPYTPSHSGPVDTPEAGPSGTKIASATGGRVLLDEFPISSVRSTADWDPELADPLAVVVFSGPEAGGSRKDKGKGKGDQFVYSIAEWQIPLPSAEDRLYSSPVPRFWPLKPAGRYGRVTPDIIGTVCQHLLDDCCYRDCDWLALACRGLGLDPEWTDGLVIRINEPLLDSVTLPSIKTAYQGRPESMLKRHDDLFRRSGRLREITDRCKRAGYASFDGLVRFNIRGTVHKPSQPLFPNVVGVAVKPSVFTMVRDNQRLPQDKKLPCDQVNLLIVIVATAFPVPHVLCITPPPFPVMLEETHESKEEDEALGEVANFIRRLMVNANANIIIYHDLKAGSYCPFPAHCRTVIELGRSPILDPCTRIKSRSRRISQAAKDSFAFGQRVNHYTYWTLTFEIILRSIERLKGKNIVTFRYTDRIFPDKSIPSERKFSRDFVDRMVLCRFSPRDDSKTEKGLSFYTNLNAAETEELYQRQIRECIKEEGREEEYKTLLAKVRKVVAIDNSGAMSPCPCCFKSGE